MNKTITAERTWQVTQFEPFHVADTITEIPEVIAKNPEAMKLLRYLQLVDIEWAYINYQLLRKNEPKTSIEDLLKFVETERNKTFEELIKHIGE